MKTTTLLQLCLSSLLLCCCLTACNTDDDTLASVSDITLEGDETTVEIKMSRDNWYIDSVDDLEGLIIGGGSTRLEGYGTLYHRYGSIVRDKGDALSVMFYDNFDEEEERGIVINLKMRDGFYAESITIRQRKSNHYYRIESIAYTLQENDGDGIESTWTRYWGINYIIRGMEEGEIRKMVFHPMYMQRINYYFSNSLAGNIQHYLSPEDKNHLIDMPKDIINGKIILEDKKVMLYENYYLNEEMGKTYEVDIVGGKKNRYSADIYYKHMQVSYMLTLIKEVGGMRKVIEGKLIKEFPYDCSPVRHEILPLDPDDRLTQ